MEHYEWLLYGMLPKPLSKYYAERLPLIIFSYSDYHFGYHVQIECSWSNQVPNLTTHLSVEFQLFRIK